MSDKNHYAITDIGASTNFTDKVISYEEIRNDGILCLKFAEDILRLQVYKHTGFNALLGSFVEVAVSRILIYPYQPIN